MSVTLYRSMAAAIAFFAWGAILLTEPSYVHGRALGTEQFLSIGGLLLMAALASTGIVSWLLGRRARFGLIAAAFVLTPAVYEGMMRFADREGDITEPLVTAKIDYHCVQKFTLGGCVGAVNECPRCARQLSSERRAIAFKRMKEIDDQMTNARIEHDEQMFHHRTPAAVGR